MCGVFVITTNAQSNRERMPVEFQSPTNMPSASATAASLDLKRFRERTHGLKHLPKRQTQAVTPSPSPRSSPVGPQFETYLIEQQIARLLRVERARRRHLPQTAEDAIDWAILLDLTRSHVRAETVYSGVLRASLDLTDAQLWASLSRLEKEGLVDGMYAAFGSCRIEVWLSEFGFERMMQTLAVV